MSDRTFRFELRVTDDTGNILSDEVCSFSPSATDEHGYNEPVFNAVASLLKKSTYDAQQLDLEAEQDSAENRADHELKIRKAEYV